MYLYKDVTDEPAAQRYGIRVTELNKCTQDWIADYDENQSQFLIMRAFISIQDRNRAWVGDWI